MVLSKSLFDDDDDDFLFFGECHVFLFPSLNKKCMKNELSSVTQTVPLECTHIELSFEWSHL